MSKDVLFYEPAPRMAYERWVHALLSQFGFDQEKWLAVCARIIGSSLRRGGSGGGTISAPSIAIEPLAAGDVALVAGWLPAAETNSWLTSEWRGRTVAPVMPGLAMRNKKNRFYLSRREGEPYGVVALVDIDPVHAWRWCGMPSGAKTREGKAVTSLALRQLVTFAFTDLGLECL